MKIFLNRYNLGKNITKFMEIKYNKKHNLIVTIIIKIYILPMKVVTMNDIFFSFNVIIMILVCGALLKKTKHHIEEIVTLVNSSITY
jgi:hypothetical protein